MSTKIPSNIVQWLAIHTFNEKGPINLDDITEGDLFEFCQIGENYRQVIAEVLFPAAPFGKAMRAVDQLQEYAALKCRAMHDRQYGLIDRALKWEKSCDMIYDQLPEFARW